MITVNKNLIDVSEMLEMGRVIEEHFKCNEPTEVEWLLLNGMSGNENPEIYATMLYMVIEGVLVAYLDQNTGKLIFRRPTYWERVSFFVKRGINRACEVLGLKIEVR